MDIDIIIIIIGTIIIALFGIIGLLIDNIKVKLICLIVYFIVCPFLTIKIKLKFIETYEEYKRLTEIINEKYEMEEIYDE